MRAILSVANREGLAELARDLRTHDVAIFSTSGTLNALQAEDIQAEAVSALRPVGPLGPESPPRRSHSALVRGGASSTARRGRSRRDQTQRQSTAFRACRNVVKWPWRHCAKGCTSISKGAPSCCFLGLKGERICCIASLG